MPGEAPVAPTVRTCEERLPQAERHRDAPHPARAHRRGLPHVLGKARQLHQAAHHPEQQLISSQNRRIAEMAYTPEKPPLAESSDQLRARIPGWGADLD